MKKILILSIGVLQVLAAERSRAAISWWNPNGTASIGGNGTWDTTTPQWSTDPNGLQVDSGSLVEWNSANAAGFCAGPAASSLQGTFTVNVDGPIDIDGLFNGSLNPGPCVLTLGGGGSLNLATSGLHAFSTFNGTGGSTTINIPITGIGAVNPQSSGSLYLYGANTYSGGTTLSGTGGVNFKAGSAFGTGAITWGISGTVLATPSATAAITLANPVTTLNGSQVFVGVAAAPVTFSGGWTLPASGTTTFQNKPAGTTVTISGVISGAANFTKDGPGTLVLKGVNTYSGGTTISAGSLTIDGSGKLGNGTYSKTIANSGTFTYSSTANQTLSGVISGTGTFIKSDSSTLTLSGANTFTKGITVSGGKLVFGAADSTGTSGTLGAYPATPVPAYITLSGGGVISTSHGGTGGTAISPNRGITIGSGGGGIELSDNSGTSFSIYTGIIAGTSGGAFIKSGPSTLALAGVSTYDGPTVINNGEIRIRSGSNRLPTGTAVTVNSPGILNLNDQDQTVASITGDGTIGLGNKTLTLTGAATTTFDGALVNISSAAAGGVTAGNGKLTVNKSTQNLTLNGVNTYTGTFTLTAGQVTVGSGATLCGDIADIAINGGTLNLNNTSQKIENLNGTGTSAIINLGSGHTLTVSPAADCTYKGVLAGTGNLVKSAGFTLNLTAVNSYTGNTTISGGAIAIDSDATLGDGTGILTLNGGSLATIASRTASSAPVANPLNVTADSTIATTSTGGTVDLNFSNDSITGTAGTLTFINNAPSGTGVFKPRFTGSGFDFNRPIEIANGTFGTTVLQSFNPTGTDQTFSGVLSGTGGYIRSGSAGTSAGRTIFTAANTYAGGSTINAGTLETQGSGTLGTGNVTVSSQTTLVLGSATSMASTANLILNSGSPSVNLNFVGTQTINALTIAGLTRAAGTWGAIGSGATHESSLFTGTGILNVTAGPADTATSLGASLNPSVYGQSVTFTATITGATPTGTVTFKDGTTTIGTGTLDGSGVATLTATLSAGSHSITASYGGDPNNDISASGVLTQVVTPLVVALSGNRPYDSTDTAAAAILAIQNKVGSDAVTLSGRATLASANGGLQSITSLGDLALGGGAAVNYTLTGAGGSVRINPAAGTFTVATKKNTAVSFATNKLYLVARDAGVTLGITAFASSGAHGTVEVGETDVTYTPETDYVGTDSFTYTLEDDVGGSTTGIINVKVNENDGLRITDVVAGENGDISLTASGLPSTNYEIQYSDDAGANWTHLASVTSAANGVLIYTDSAPPESSRWYRLVQPSN